jgi:hypothetical protein
MLVGWGLRWGEISGRGELQITALSDVMVSETKPRRFARFYSALIAVIETGGTNHCQLLLLLVLFLFLLQTLSNLKRSGSIADNQTNRMASVKSLHEADTNHGNALNTNFEYVFLDLSGDHALNFEVSIS